MHLLSCRVLIRLAQCYIHQQHNGSKFLLEMFRAGYINLDGILSSTRSYTPEKLIVEGENLKTLHTQWESQKKTLLGLKTITHGHMRLRSFLMQLV